MAAVQESRPALSEKLGIDFVVKQLDDPETEIVAAAATLLGNLAHEDGMKDERSFLPSFLQNLLTTF